MLKSTLERPALLMSALGLLLVGFALIGIGAVNFGGAFAADRSAFLGAFIFLLAGGWCLTVSLLALLGRPSSTGVRSALMAVGWVGAAYPLSLALTYFGSAYMAALPIAIVGIALALISLGRKQTTGAGVL